MAKHAADLARVLDELKLGRVAVAGVSIGGYVVFEFWRRYAARVSALVLSNTRPQADTAEGRQGRLQAAADVLERGTEPFLNNLIPRLIGRTTFDTRPDLVEGARSMMRQMSADDVAQVQRGMAERPDSVEALKTIRVPTLIITGEEDVLSPVADAELMRQNIAGSRMSVVPRAGHYAVWERPEEVGGMVRQFLDAAGA
jgi:pimeloyl-ACP methyl ester carboxylesterase